MLVAVAGVPALAGLLGVLLVAYLASARNVVGHVVVAASEPSELERIRCRVRACIDWTLERCDQVLLVAHSQGGFICHSVLDAGGEPPPPRRVRGLIGIGSGLKPIWLLQQLSRREIAAAAWITTLATAVGEASIVSLLSGVDPSLTAAARGVIDLGAQAALPLGAISAVSVQGAFSRIDALSLIGLPDSLRHAGALPLMGLAVFLAACMFSRRIWKRALTRWPARGPGAIRAQRWIELSSYHDPIGRLLFPTLPSPAIENAVAVGGHPIRDHVAYFRRSSVLPWMIASEVFKTIKIRPQRDIAQTTAALQLSAERRRVCRYGLFLAVFAGGTLPAVAGGRPLFAAVASLAVVLLGVAVVLSVTFLIIETWANRRALNALRTAIEADAPFEPPRLPVPAAKRRAPAWVALGMSILAFCVVFPLVGYSSAGAGAFMLLAVLFAAYCAAIVAGYRPWRWLLVLVVFWTVLDYLEEVPSLPNAPPSLPEFYALPAVPAVFAVTCGVCVLVALLRPKRISGASGELGA